MWDVRELLLTSLLGVGVFLIAVGIVALIAVWLIKRLLRLGQDSCAPRLTVEARVSGRRREHRFYGTKHRRTRSTTYYAVFLLKNGMHVELWMSKRSYKRLVEDSVGMLTYQGSRFVKFEPIEEQETG